MTTHRTPHPTTYSVDRAGTINILDDASATTEDEHEDR